ncbi:hypothetical protein EYF80_029431 [Liparis tanakae]|uniref:Uncharacterized protein n=1 Tax=Liparis tanakae TaxID=230148 RepID=A0A4Z2H4G9_9TELE|nr:hypothetical protein EYF80_029431 [Liparis tanakae]
MPAEFRPLSPEIHGVPNTDSSVLWLVTWKHRADSSRCALAWPLEEFVFRDTGLDRNGGQ